MTYAEAIAFLFELQKFGAVLGLERARRLAELAGNPQEKLRFIHVAGTNGKGSTCAFLESIYRAAGLKVGLFTSPHLISFTERIQINRVPISETEVARLAGILKGDVQTFAAGDEPTFFEVVTAMALRYFSEQAVDLVIWETGLGGRLDATNIVTPIASVITNIQHDHEKWLGSTLAEIAREKAGIIKPGVPVVTGVQDDSAWRVIEQTAKERNALIHRVLPTDGIEPIVTSVLLKLRGAHQISNATLAAVTVRAAGIPVRHDVLRRGLQEARWAGRFDVREIAGRGTVIFDGAHNPEGAEALRLTFESEFPYEKADAIVGILRDKDTSQMCREFASISRRVFTVPVRSDRSADAAELARDFYEANAGLEVHVCASLAEALEKTRSSPLTLITGSLYFIGEALEALGVETGAAGERALNDWKAKDRR